MIRSTPRPARKPKPAAAARSANVFRDFVRQLEKLDSRQKKEGGR
jgi:hypothetical protein